MPGGMPSSGCRKVNQTGIVRGSWNCNWTIGNPGLGGWDHVLYLGSASYFGHLQNRACLWPGRKAWPMEDLWGPGPQFYFSSQYRGLLPAASQIFWWVRINRRDERINGEDQSGENVAKCQFIIFISCRIWLFDLCGSPTPILSLPHKNVYGFPGR